MVLLPASSSTGAIASGAVTAPNSSASMSPATARRPRLAGTGTAELNGRRQVSSSAYRRRPGGRVLREATEDDRRQARRDDGSRPAGRCGRLGGDPSQQRHQVAVLERRAAREQVIQRGSDGIDVGAGIQPLTAQLLRRGKLRRALERGHLTRLRDVGREHRDREAEIADLHRAVGFDEAVRRLHVPVEDAAGQRGLEACHHLQNRVDRSRRRHRPVAVDDVLQRAARHEFHRDDGVAADLLTAEDEDRVRMIEGSGQLALAEEPRAIVGTREPLIQHLERDAAAVIEVFGFVDLPHSSLSEEACDPVRADDLPVGEAGTVARRHRLRPIPAPGEWSARRRSKTTSRVSP